MFELFENICLAKSDTDGVTKITVSNTESEIPEICGFQLLFEIHEKTLASRVTVSPLTQEFITLIHIVSGTAWYWSEATGRIPVNESQIIIQLANIAYDCAAGNEGAVIDSLSFTGTLPHSLHQSGVLNQGIFECGQQRKLMPILELVALGDNENRIRAASMLMTLITEIHFDNKYNTPKEGESKIKNLTAIIQKNPEKSWDSSQMAQYCNLSEVQFRRVFKKETGSSPKVYLDTVKMNHAAQLLKREFSVGIVSDLLGYSDQFHFSRRFKAILGASPREYLQQNR
ncbi:MAG: AraC family transcriptional regulator [Fibrobacterales bacterium]